MVRFVRVSLSQIHIEVLIYTSSILGGGGGVEEPGEAGDGKSGFFFCCKCYPYLICKLNSFYILF